MKGCQTAAREGSRRVAIQSRMRRDFTPASASHIDRMRAQALARTHLRTRSHEDSAGRSLVAIRPPFHPSFVPSLSSPLDSSPTHLDTPIGNSQLPGTLSMTIFSGLTPALVMFSTAPRTSGSMHSVFQRAWTIPMRRCSAPGNEVGAGAGPLMEVIFVCCHCQYCLLVRRRVVRWSSERGRANE